MYRLFGFATTCLVTLYTIVYILWRLLLISPLYERNWQIQITEIFGSWFYLPLLPLIVLILLSKRWRAASVLCIPFAFFAWEYGTQFLPNWQHSLVTPVYAQSTRSTLRVMTWNSHQTYDPRGDFMQRLEELKPDVVTLQEVSLGMKRKSEEVLGAQYPYQSYQPRGSLLTLSRHPLTEPRLTELPFSACRCLPVEITKNGKTFTVINVHIPRPAVVYNTRGTIPTISYFDSRGQELYYAILTKILEKTEGTVLIQGDFNTTERQRHFRLLGEKFRDSFAEAGWGMGYTYPNVRASRPFWLIPIIQIDHILHSRDLLATTAWTGMLKSSDHLYVVADLHWK